MGGTRTLNPLLAADFKSAVYTNSTTIARPALLTISAPSHLYGAEPHYTRNSIAAAPPRPRMRGDIAVEPTHSRLKRATAPVL